MTGYIEVWNMHGDGMQARYYRGAGSFLLSAPVSVWIIPGTLTP